MDDFAREVAAQGDDDAIRAILGRVCDVTHMGFAAVARVTDRRWIACQIRDKIEFGLKPGEELDLKTTICDEIRATGNAVVIDEVGAQETWRTHPTPMLYGFESYVSLPITLADGRFFGTLCAIDPAPRTLSTGTIVTTLQAFARQIGDILSQGGTAGNPAAR